MTSHRSLSLVLGVAGCLTFAGCATLDIPWIGQAPKASSRNPVVQILCMWEPSEGRDPNGAPCRGFAGQILFLGNRGGTPVAVDGEMMVYVFDDFGTEEDQAKPVHQFNFDAVAWRQHMRVGTLGPAYHCFIPYTRPGGLQANCTLRVKYVPKSGQGMTSDPSHIALKGKPRTGDAQVQVAQRKPLVYETSQPLDRPPVRTTTISMQPTAPATWTREGDIVPASYTTPASEETDPHFAAEQRAQQVLDDFRRQQAALRASGQTTEPSQKVSPRLRINSQAIRTADVAVESEPLEIEDEVDSRAEEMIRNFTADQHTTSTF